MWGAGTEEVREVGETVLAAVGTVGVEEAVVMVEQTAESGE